MLFRSNLTSIPNSYSIYSCICPANQYLSNSYCLSCPINKVSDPNSTSLTQCVCDNNFYGSTSCISCPTGKSSFQNSSSTADCHTADDVPPTCLFFKGTCACHLTHTKLVTGTNRGSWGYNPSKALDGLLGWDNTWNSGSDWDPVSWWRVKFPQTTYIVGGIARNREAISRSANFEIWIGNSSDGPSSNTLCFQAPATETWYVQFACKLTGRYLYYARTKADGYPDYLKLEIGRAHV